MSRFFKSVVAGILVLSVCAFGTSVWADDLPINGSVPIGVNMPIQISGNLLVTVIDGDGDGNQAIGFDPTGVTLDQPWRTSEDYIEVGFQADGNVDWAVKIVTDNVNYLEAVNGGDYQGAVPGEDQDSDGDGNVDSVSYGGMIRVANGTITANPSERVTLGWQVYDSPTAIAVPVADDFTMPEGWNSNWAYLADLSSHAIGQAPNWDWISVLNQNTGKLEYNYSLCVVGGAILSEVRGFHPFDLDADGEHDKTLTKINQSGINPYAKDVYIYLAGKFSNTFYFDTNGDGDIDTVNESILPGGSYSTNMYVNMFIE